jgi:hypothetical protein
MQGVTKIASAQQSCRSHRPGRRQLFETFDPAKPEHKPNLRFYASVFYCLDHAPGMFRGECDGFLHENMNSVPGGQVHFIRVREGRQADHNQIETCFLEQLLRICEYARLSLRILL